MTSKKIYLLFPQQDELQLINNELPIADRLNRVYIQQKNKNI